MGLRRLGRPTPAVRSSLIACHPSLMVACILFQRQERAGSSSQFPQQALQLCHSYISALPCAVLVKCISSLLIPLTANTALGLTELPASDPVAVQKPRPTASLNSQELGVWARSSMRTHPSELLHSLPGTERELEKCQEASHLSKWAQEEQGSGETEIMGWGPGREHGKVSAQLLGLWAQRERKVLGKQGRKCPGGPQCVAWGGPTTSQGSLLDQEGCPLSIAPFAPSPTTQRATQVHGPCKIKEGQRATPMP